MQLGSKSGVEADIADYMPLSRYVLYKKGVEIYLAPTADGRDTWLPSMQHIAMEGRCFVVSGKLVVRAKADRQQTSTKRTRISRPTTPPTLTARPAPSPRCGPAAERALSARSARCLPVRCGTARASFMLM